MTNKNTEILDLGPVEQFELQDDGIMLFNGNPLNYRELERMADTARTQGAGIVAIQQKAKKVQRSIGEITVSGVRVFDDTIGSLMEIRDRHGKGSERYRWVASFVEQAAQEFGHATLQATRIGKRWLLQIQYASPFPPEEDKPRVEKRTWLGRLLLGDTNDTDQGYY